MKKSLMLIIVVSLFLAGEVCADIGIKKLVIENCAEAKAKIATLNEADRKELIQFLGMVFKLQGGGAQNNLSTTQPRIGGMFDPSLDPSQASVWRIFDPKHEEDAKHCAAEILISFGAEGFPVLSESFELLKVQGLSTQLYDHVFDASVLIPQKLIETKGEFTDADLQRYIQLLYSPSDDVRVAAENVLLILSERAIPLLIAELRLKRGNEAKRIRETLLLFKDQSGVGMGILPLLDSVEIEPRIDAIRIMGSLTQFKAQSYPILFKLLGDPSNKVRENAFEAIASLGFDGELSSITQKNLIENVLMTESVQEIERLGGLLANIHLNDELLIGYSAKLCDTSKTALIKEFLELIEKSKDHPEPYIACAKKALNHQDDGVVEIGLRALTNFRVPYEAVKKNVISLLKKLKEDPSKQNIALSLYNYVEKQAPVEELLQLLPQFMELISPQTFALQSALERTLLSLGDKVTPVLVKIISAPSGRITSFALASLSKIKSKKFDFPKQFILFLNKAQFTDDLMTAAQILRQDEQGYRKLLTPLLKPKKISPGILYAGAYLGMLDEKGLKLLLVDFNKFSCQARLLIASRTDNNQILDATKTCVIEKPFEILLTANNAAFPIKESLAVPILDALVAQSSDKLPQFLELIDRWKEIGFKEQQIVTALSHIVAIVPNTFRLAIIEQLLTFPVLPPEVLNSIREIANNESIEPPVRFRAARLLHKSLTPTFDGISYFISALKSPEKSWVESVILEHPEWFQEVLRVALNEFDGPEKAFVISIIGRSAAVGQQFLGTLLTLTDSRVRSVRDSAVIALLKLGHTEPHNLKALGRVMSQPIRRELLKDCALLSWTKSGIPCFIAQQISINCL